MQSAVWKHLEGVIHGLRVLVVDDNQYMRKLVRNLLLNIGIKDVHEAADGIDGLEAIRTIMPDLVILDWEMPLLNGPEMVRIVRSPGVFPGSDVPIIMLTAHGERWRVVEAVRIGVNEFMVKPVSAKGLLDRIVSIMANPRRVVRVGDYYGPEPRNHYSEPLQPLEEIVAPAPTGLRH
jgi:two-component system, chemotaxis family, chemotaxis protein CheY